MESLVGTNSIFASAYQKMTGGNLEGQEAINAMITAVESGKVNAAEIWPLVAEEMKRRAQPKLDISKKLSTAEQARFTNVKNKQTMKFGEAGGEEGYARFWWALTRAMGESTEEMEFFGRAFDKVMYGFSKFVLLPQSIKRMFQGRDSLVGDWLSGIMGDDQLQEWITQIKSGFGEVGAAAKGAFQTIKNGFTEMLNFSKENGITESIMKTFADLGIGLANGLDIIALAGEQDDGERQKIIDRMALRSEKSYIPNLIGSMVGHGKMTTLGAGVASIANPSQVVSGLGSSLTKSSWNSAMFMEKGVILDNINSKLKEKHGIVLSKEKIESVLSEDNKNIDQVVDELYQKHSTGGFKNFKKEDPSVPKRPPSNFVFDKPLNAFGGAGFTKSIDWNTATEQEKSDFSLEAKKAAALRFGKSVDIEGQLSEYNNSAAEPLSIESLMRFIKVNSVQDAPVEMNEQAIEKVISGINGSRPNEITLHNTFQISETVNAQGTAEKVVEVVTAQISSMLQNSMLPYANAV